MADKLSQNDIKIAQEAIDEAAEPQLNDEIRDELNNELEQAQEALNRQNQPHTTPICNDPFEYSKNTKNSENFEELDNENLFDANDVYSPEANQNLPTDMEIEMLQYSNYSRNFKKDGSSEKYSKSNDEDFSMYSENEVRDLLTPVKKQDSPIDQKSNFPDCKANSLNAKDPNAANDANNSQNDCVYGGGSNISYCNNKVNTLLTNDFNNKQNSSFQYQNMNGAMNNSYQNSSNNIRPNMYIQDVNRRILPQNYGMYGQKIKQLPHQINNQQTESLITHYTKIIDELKEENVRVKDILESTIKQKDLYMKNIVDEHKKIIDEKNLTIESQNKLIDQITNKLPSLIAQPTRSRSQNLNQTTLPSKTDDKEEVVSFKSSNQNKDLNANSKYSLNFRNQNFKQMKKRFKMPTKQSNDEEFVKQDTVKSKITNYNDTNNLNTEPQVVSEKAESQEIQSPLKTENENDFGI